MGEEGEREEEGEEKCKIRDQHLPPGQTLNVDLKEFYSSLYSILFEVVSSASVNSELLRNLMECFDMMFALKREVNFFNFVEIFGIFCGIFFLL
jgi:hypothetical protein